MRNRIPIIIGIIVVAIAAWTVWRFAPHKASPPAARLQTVTVALDWTPNTDHTGMYVAQAKGWYKEQGIDLKILPYSSDVTSSTLLDTGKADVGIVSTEDIVSGQAKGHPLTAIGAVLQHNTSGLIVRADSGITTPKDLDGKTYGGWGSPLETAVVGAIIKNAGGQGTVKNVTLDVSAMPALESRKIDVVWVLAGWELIQAKRDGLANHFFPVTKYGIPDSPTLSFTVAPDKLKTQPNLLSRFMKATAQGYEYARQHPQESAQILIKGTPKGTFPDEGLVIESQSYVSTQYADAGGKWGTENATAWKNYTQFLLGAGTVTDASDKPVTTLNIPALYNNQFVQ
ncbi:MAG TPA: ABC transporter substrate-binding protein [Candidatus Saccharimonadia bacterium]|jgi:ABC-type nitrate/sulfonate/bicarbonate transport system substrate-binding protein|nr:ABC transporter substrate-binding protein [Candidatus Saccharimonadia bacterium]